MTDDLRLHEQMTLLARDLQAEVTADATLQMTVDAARTLIAPCRSAGVSLATRRGEIRSSVATDDVPRRGDELQIELGQGPCRDAVWDHHTVVVRDLAHEQRWRRWAPAATAELGMRSMLCLRLFTHRDRVGALNLYAAEADAFSEADIEVGHAVAAHAAIAVVAAEKIDNLETGLVSRAVIGQATGLLMRRYEMTSAAAFALLVRLSSESNRKVAVIAAALVAEHDRDPLAASTIETRPPGPRPVRPRPG